MTKTASGRFMTLDVFRGITIFGMIIVNTQGSGAVPFDQLMHSEWNGCTLTDLVFPAFLFAVGNAMFFSMKKLQFSPRRVFFYRIAKRSFLIFLVGYLLTWFPFAGWNGQGNIWMKPFGETRIMAVLQRIALAYFFAAILLRFISLRGIWITSVILLFFYWGLLLQFGDPGNPFSLEGNAVRKLDLILLGPQHMYRERGVAFDPEGILSGLPAIVNILAGYLTAEFMIRKGKSVECILKLLIAGIILIGIARIWNSSFPINKKLWTSSYVLYSSGIDIIALAVLYFLIEIKNWKTGVSFFAVFGKNPLFIYVLSNILGVFFLFYVDSETPLIDWINQTFFQRITPGAIGSLLFSICFTLLCWSAGWWMDKKKIYVRL